MCCPVQSAPGVSHTLHLGLGMQLSADHLPSTHSTHGRLTTP
jgi:hypothetical protein